MTVNFEDGGSCSFMDGIRAMYPRIIVAIAPILPDSSGSWKKIARLTKARRKIGIKIVASELPGYLYRGIMKWVYWKYFTLGNCFLATADAGFKESRLIVLWASIYKIFISASFFSSGLLNYLVSDSDFYFSFYFSGDLRASFSCFFFSSYFFFSSSFCFFYSSYSFNFLF